MVERADVPTGSNRWRSNMPRSLPIAGLGLLLELLVLSGVAACGLRTSASHGTRGPGAPTTCIDIAAGAERPEFGCFNIAAARGLRFGEAAVYWHLYTFP